MKVVELDNSYPRYSTKTKLLLPFSCSSGEMLPQYLNQYMIHYGIVQMVLQCPRLPPQKQPSNK